MARHDKFAARRTAPWSIPRRPLRWLAPVVFLALLVLTLGVTQQRSADLPLSYWYQLLPFTWPSRVENHDFRDTVDEQQCFNGSVSRINFDDAPVGIPRIVHFTWGLKGDGTFNLALYLAIRAALLNIQPDEIQLHYSFLDRTNPYFQRLAPNLTLVHHDPDELLALHPKWHVAHLSDVIRLQALSTTGGIYLDSDVFALRSFDDILRGPRDAVLAHEGGNRYGLCNAVVLAKPGSRFIARWLAAYDGFAEQDWNYHSVVLPRKLADRHPDELCALSPTAFFWPLWTPGHVDYMHRELRDHEAAEVQATIDRNGGGLYDNQLAYHAWSHNSYDKYVERLTREEIRTRNTRFNMILRKFLD